MKRNLLGCAAVAALTVNGAFAESEAANLDDGFVVDELVVVGTRSAIESRLEAINPDIVVSREEIARYGDQSAGDVLKRLPGIVVGGPPGENKDVRLRGLDKEFTQILINGKRIPGGGEKREFQVDRIPASLIERIEIIRNPRPDIDAQGIAGTINIVLREIPGTPFTEIQVGASRLDGKQVRPRGSITSGGRTGDFGYVIAADVQRRENKKDKIKEVFKPDGALKDSETEDEEKVFTDISLAPRFSYQPGGDLSFGLAPLFLRSEEDKTKTKLKFSGSGKLKEREDETEEKVRKALGFDGSVTKTLDALGELSLDLGYRRNTEDKDKIKQKFKGGALNKEELEVEEKEDTEFSAIVRWRDLAFGDHLLAVTADLLVKDRDKIKTKTENGKNKTAPKDTFFIEETKLSGSFSDIWSVTPRWTVSPGVRVEYLDRDATNLTGFTQSDKQAYANPSFQTTYDWADWVVLRLAFSRTVRQPKFDELVPVSEEKDGTFSKPDKGGNPELKAEKAWGLDSGVDFALFDKSGIIGINAFYRRIGNKVEKNILRDPETNRFVEIPENVGTGEAYGLEIDGTIPGSSIGIDGLSLHGNATFLDSTVTIAATGETRPFKEQPNLIYNVGFDQQIGSIGLAFGGNFHHVSARRKIEFKDGARVNERESAVNTADVYIRQHLWDGAELRFSVTDLIEAEKEKQKTFFKPNGSVNKIEKEFEASGPTYLLSLTMSF